MGPRNSNLNTIWLEVGTGIVILALLAMLLYQWLCWIRGTGRFGNSKYFSHQTGFLVSLARLFEK